MHQGGWCQAKAIQIREALLQLAELRRILPPGLKNGDAGRALEINGGWNWSWPHVVTSQEWWFIYLSIYIYVYVLYIHIYIYVCVCVTYVYIYYIHMWFIPNGSISGCFQLIKSMGIFAIGNFQRSVWSNPWDSDRMRYFSYGTLLVNSHITMENHHF